MKSGIAKGGIASHFREDGPVDEQGAFKEFCVLGRGSSGHVERQETYVQTNRSREKKNIA